MANPARKKADSQDASSEFWPPNSWSSASASQMMDIAENQLTVWRQNADLARQAIRLQQDQMLKFWQTQLRQFNRALQPPAIGLAPSAFLSPMMAVLKATEQMQEAALHTQHSSPDGPQSN